MPNVKNLAIRQTLSLQDKTEVGTPDGACFYSEGGSGLKGFCTPIRAFQKIYTPRSGDLKMKGGAFLYRG